MDVINNIENSVAIIYNDNNSYFAKEIQKNGIQVFSAYKPLNVIFRVLRKIHFKLKLPGSKIWFQKNHTLKKFDSIIIFDAVKRFEYLSFIREKYPQKRLILWYWNPVRNSITPDLLKEIKCEKWSYSIEDCTKHNLKYNTTFYFNSLTDSNILIDSIVPTYDIFFVGRDKGRLSLLLEYKEKFKLLGMKTNFHITPTNWYEKRKNKIYKNDVSYKDIIKQISKSKAILDIVQNQSDGLTLRPMESLFFKKKLITNSKIINEYDFYCKENIFILGIDIINDLPKFLESPYKPIPTHIIQKYEFNEWLDRFN